MTDRYCPICDRSFGDDLQRCPHDGSPLLDPDRIAQSDPLIGETIDGRYTITARLGGGGMGVVYKARQKVIEADVALKVVAPHLFERSDAARRFMREARLSSRIRHRNIVSATDFGRTEDGRYFLVTDFVPGCTLSEAIRSAGTMPRARAVDIAVQLCDALTAAHEAGVVHRDLKPGNVMLVEQDGRDTVKVLDFGLARSLTDSGTPLTTAGAVLGTAAYLPPEQALGRVPDGRGDLYALGCMLYEMLSGRPPFAHVRSIAALAMHHAQFPPPALPDHVPPVLANVVMRLLAKDAEDRYPTAAATRAALEAALEAAVDFEPPAAPTETFVRPSPVGLESTLEPPAADAPLTETRDAPLSSLPAGLGAPSHSIGGQTTDIVAPARPERRPRPARPTPAEPEPQRPWGLWGLAVILAGTAIWLAIPWGAALFPELAGSAEQTGATAAVPDASGLAANPADSARLDVAPAPEAAAPDAAAPDGMSDTALPDAAPANAASPDAAAGSAPPDARAAVVERPPTGRRRAARVRAPAAESPAPATPVGAPKPAAAEPPTPAVPVDLEALAIDPAAE